MSTTTLDVRENGHVDEEDRRKRITVKEIRREEKLAARDYVARGLALFAWALSMGAYWYYFSMGTSENYVDSISHLEIARRVFDSPTTGLAQLGGVWLPLPHILSLLLVWADPLYFSGFAGSAFSMLAFVIASVLIYKITYRLTNNKAAGLVAAAVFMFNPNVLYMQSTPMTELPLFACMAGMVYGVQRWIQTDSVKALTLGSIAAVLGSLTRYEAWPMTWILVAVVAFSAWRKGYGRRKLIGTTLAFLQYAAIGQVLWAVWCLLIFRNPLYFQEGEYAKPSLWVKTGERPVGNLPFSLFTYSDAVYENLLIGVVVLGITGMIVMIVRERLALRTLPILSLTAIFPFFVVTLFLGQRPLHVVAGVGNYYNVRFGLLMVIPAAVFIGYLVGKLSGRKLLRGTAIGISSAVILATALPTVVEPKQNVVTLNEPTSGLNRAYELSLNASKYLRSQYDGGKIMGESFGNELVLYRAGITPGNNVYEGSFKQWEPALKDPYDNNIRWIVMRRVVALDKVYKALYGKPALTDHYTLAYTASGYYIYKRK